MLNKLKNLFSAVKKDWELVVLMALTLWLRFANLGYSDFQGDEIKALLIPDEGQTIWNFLLTQRKGPVQFLVTYLLGFITPDYSNRLIMRLPFAIAGALAVFFFFKLLTIHLKSKKLAFFTSFFLATNGFFVAFSRLVQYQSFVIFFMILALYFFSLASTEESWKTKGLYLGFISWALSILSHYDGVFIFPFVLYLVYLWAKKYEALNFKKLFKAFFLPSLIFVITLLSFYIPFVLELSKKTLDYWQGRIEGVEDKISSSIYLFTIYQPIYVIHIYTILGGLGILNILAKCYKAFKQKNLEEALLYTTLLIWFAIPFAFLEGLVSIPGTHIYTYLIPAFIGLSFGINLISLLVSRLLGKIAFAKFLFWSGIFVIFTFIFAQSNQIFVDHQKEYPWENEKFLLWTFSRPTPIFHLSMFGFPYYRNWEEIGNIVMGAENNGFYATNEKDSISRFHIKLKKSTDDAGHYIYIKNPQSFIGEVTNEKAKYWMKNYSPITTFFKDGDPIVEIYYTPQGDLKAIKNQGF